MIMGVDFGFELHKELLINELQKFITQIQTDAEEYNRSSEAFEHVKIKIEEDEYGYVIWINYIPIAFYYGRRKDENGKIDKRAVYPIEEIQMIERPCFTNFLYNVFARYLEVSTYKTTWVYVFDEGSPFISIRLPDEEHDTDASIKFLLDFSWRTQEIGRRIKKTN